MFESYDIDYFIFGIMPYVALTVLIVGSIARYERDPFTWKSSSSQLLRQKQLFWGSILFHVGIIVVFWSSRRVVHADLVLDALGVPYALKQWLAVLVGGVAGVFALIGASMLIHRRVTDPRIWQTTSFADIGILVLIWLQLFIGLGTIFLTLQHMDGSEMVRFMTWSQSVVMLNLNAWAMVVDVHWLYKTHIFLGLLITILFPFTRLVHIFSGFAAPVRYLLARPGYQIVRSRRQTPLPPRREPGARQAAAGAPGSAPSTPAE
ncbi:MAG: respiratory nitrate reductase subunit gamma [Alphaproteobacteria bacterium]|nr:respiratory nitrate reductase subunit gamma [Alphaproteobacteria bacterium]